MNGIYLYPKYSLHVRKRNIVLGKTKGERGLGVIRKRNVKSQCSKIYLRDRR